MLPASVPVDRTLPSEASIRHVLEEHAAREVGPDADLSRLHRVLYPVFRVEFAYAEEGQFPWSRSSTAAATTLVDGLWADNHRHLQRYRETAESLERVALSGYDFGEKSEGLGRTVLLDFQVANDRAASLLPRRIENIVESEAWDDPDTVTGAFAAELWETFDIPDEVRPESFEEVTEVTQLYLPFWVAEVERPDRRDLFGAVRTGNDVEGERSNPHEWLSEFVREDTSRLARYAHASTRERSETDDGPRDRSAASSEGSGDRAPSESAEERTDAAAEETPTPDEAPVQPDDADLEAASLVEASPDRSFGDVGGMDELKRQLQRSVIAPVERPETYSSYGLDPVSGVVLYGPPGCGKTYVAGALAGELDYAFIDVSPADLTSKWMGKPAENVADAFEIARANQPCVLFLDEIDAIAGALEEQSGTSERQMVNQLLAELEAIDDDDVLVLAATNLLEDVDDAVLRTGRFDERIEVPPPDADARREIFEVHLQERPLADDLSLDRLVDETAGYAASDIEHISEDGARRALRAGEPISTEHLLAAAEEADSSVPDRAGSSLGDGKTVTQPDGVDLSARSLLSASVDRTFEDVGGMTALEGRLRETVVEPLAKADRYEEYGLDATSGVLLHGPPGCGKTYVAGALAGELDYAYLSVSPADLTSKWMGKPAENVADVFEIARANQPCILFLDEIDAVAGARGGGDNASQRQMVNQLLAELESLDGEDVVAVAATNRVDDVDGAVLRSGRFDERIEVPPPDADARREILEVHLADRPVADALRWKPVVEHTAGYAASDLALLADNAARKAMHDDEPVDEEHLLTAVKETRSSIDDWTTASADAIER